MLNPDLQLNQKLFASDVEQKPTRDGYGAGLLALGEKDPDVVALCADLTESTRTEAFAKKFPERFFEMGVAEQNMVTVAAGLAVAGKVPFVASYATFSPGRNWEQIRTTVAYNNANVKIAGHHTGISVGRDGATHQATEDIAIMRALPNMRVIVPCDAIEAEKATFIAGRLAGPMYLRFQREATPVITTVATPFKLGHAEVLWNPSTNVGMKKPDVLIIGCGPLLFHVLEAARLLEKEKISVIVLNSHTIKPLDEKTIIELAKRAGAVVTVEEHQIYGGLGGAVAELLAAQNPVPMEFIGLDDTFGESGTPAELLEKYGMGVKDIIAAARKAKRRK